MRKKPSTGTPEYSVKQIYTTTPLNAVSATQSANKKYRSKQLQKKGGSKSQRRARPGTSKKDGLKRKSSNSNLGALTADQLVEDGSTNVATDAE